MLALYGIYGHIWHHQVPMFSVTPSDVDVQHAWSYHDFRSHIAAGELCNAEVDRGRDRDS